MVEGDEIELHKNKRSLLTKKYHQKSKKSSHGVEQTCLSSLTKQRLIFKIYKDDKHTNRKTLKLALQPITLYFLFWCWLHW